MLRWIMRHYYRLKPLHIRDWYNEPNISMGGILSILAGTAALAMFMSWLTTAVFYGY